MTCLHEPLYPGAVVTICAVYCAIMTYAITNKLPYSSIENLSKLLHLLCPASNHLPSSLYKLKSFFQNFTSSYKKSRVCAECERVLNTGESCHERNGYMIQVPVEKALKTIVESELLYSRKYWRSLNLAVWSQVAKIKILADLNLAVVLITVNLLSASCLDLRSFCTDVHTHTHECRSRNVGAWFIKH